MYNLVHRSGKMGKFVLKWGQTCTMIPYEHPEWSKIFFGKRKMFRILSTNWPICNAFGDLEGAKIAHNG